MGAWELSAFAHALMAEPMHVVVRPLDNALDRCRSRETPQRLREYVDSKKDAARAIFRALQRNEAVGVLDRPECHPERRRVRGFLRRAGMRGNGIRSNRAKNRRRCDPRLCVVVEQRRRYVLRFYPILEFTGDIQTRHAVIAQPSRRSHSRISGSMVVDSPSLENPSIRIAFILLK